MKLYWDEEKSGGNRYFNLSVDSREQEHLEMAMEAWWEKLCELAPEAEDWDVIIGDIWVETGRIIGHVQRTDADIGEDRGFRVCVMFSLVGDEMEKADFSDEIYSAMSDRLYELLDSSIRAPKTLERLTELKSGNSFKLWWCENGYVIAEPVFK